METYQIVLLTAYISVNLIFLIIGFKIGGFTFRDFILTLFFGCLISLWVMIYGIYSNIEYNIRMKKYKDR